jgi:uncharacterized protein
LLVLLRNGFDIHGVLPPSCGESLVGGRDEKIINYSPKKEMEEKKMARRIGVVGIVILGMAFMLLGRVADSADLPKVIALATLAPGTSMHTVSTGEAEIISNNTPMRVMVESYEGPGVFLPLMEKGQVELAMANCVEAYWAYHGLLSYKEPTGGKGYPGLRTIFLDSTALTGMVAGRDTGIMKTADLKGKRIGQVDAVHLSPHLTNRAFVANGGLDPDKDVVWVPCASIEAGNKLLQEKKVDAATNAFGAAFVEEVNAARGAVWVSCDPSPEARKRFTDIHPATFVQLKNGAGTGVVQDTWLASFRRGIHCWASMKDDVAYSIAQTIYNNVDKLKGVHPLVKELTKETLCTTDAVAPFHPGAVKFFKEKGLWTDEMQRHQEALLARKK